MRTHPRPSGSAYRAVIPGNTLRRWLHGSTAVPGTLQRAYYFFAGQLLQVIVSEHCGSLYFPPHRQAPTRGIYPGNGEVITDKKMAGWRY